jgi:hypothetical protein
MKAIIEKLDGETVRYLDHTVIKVEGTVIEGYNSVLTGPGWQPDATYILLPGYCVIITDKEETL